MRPFSSAAPRAAGEPITASLISFGLRAPLRSEPSRDPILSAPEGADADNRSFKYAQPLAERRVERNAAPGQKTL